MKIYNTNKCLCTLSAVVPSRLVSLFSLSDQENSDSNQQFISAGKYGNND